MMIAAKKELQMAESPVVATTATLAVVAEPPTALDLKAADAALGFKEVAWQPQEYLEFSVAVNFSVKVKGSLVSVFL